MPEQDRDPRVPLTAWFVATSQRAALLVVLGYLLVVMLAVSFLEILATVQGIPDDIRTRHASIFFAVVMAFPFAWALRNVFRRPRLPSYKRLTH